MIRRDGSLNAFGFHREGQYSGPALWVFEGGGSQRIELVSNEAERREFLGTCGAVSLGFSWAGTETDWQVTVTAINGNDAPWAPERLALKLGVDCRMQPFPQWRRKFYPTMLRCERTHFWGYVSSPEGNVVVLGSPDPVAGWSLDYAMGTWDDGTVWGAQIVNTFDLDLLHRGPLPSRHPQHLAQLGGREKRTWRIRGRSRQRGADLFGVWAELCEAPVLEVQKTTAELGEAGRVICHGGRSPFSFEQIGPDGQRSIIGPTAKNEFSVIVNKAGLHEIIVCDSRGREAQALVRGQGSWLEVLREAGRFALKYPPQAIAHCEGWYGYFSGFLAQKYFPDFAQRERLSAYWSELQISQFDGDGFPLFEKWRVQNKSTMISLLVDRYEVWGDEGDLEQAAGLADAMILEHQTDGPFLARGVFYTTVIYPIKSLLELIQKEQLLEGAVWRERTQRHWHSVKAGIQDLLMRGDDLETEGDRFFEDGMISCAALQLSLFALSSADKKLNGLCKLAAQRLLGLHDCLAQTVTPDGRVRGGTHRTWEAQYDVHLFPAVSVCPHGWSAWRTYAAYYLYLLTNEVSYLREVRNALGGAAQLVDQERNRLHWGFVLDPHIKAQQITTGVENPTLGSGGFAHPDFFPHKTFEVSEQYLDMVSHWSTYGSNDNDVHEHFKCLDEVIGGKAYVHEEEDQAFFIWNCQVRRREDDQIEIVNIGEKVSLIYLVLRVPAVLVVNQREWRIEKGAQWLDLEKEECLGADAVYGLRLR